MNVLSFPSAIYDELLTHLASKKVEQVAFLFTQPPAPDNPLRVSEIYPVPCGGFDHQSEFHVALTDDVRGRVIRRAHELGGCLVEVHSHGGGEPARFSPSDLHGFSDWVPHVRWRLRRRPYVALVFAGRAFDALVWEADSLAPLERLDVDGRPPQRPSGITYQRLVARGR